MNTICEVSGKTFKAAVDAVTIAASKKDLTHPVLECVRVECNGSLRMIAADPYRIHVADLGIPCAVTGDYLVNAAALRKVKVKPGAMVDLAIMDDTMIVGGVTLPLVLETYPDYQQIIPTRFAWSFAIDAEELCESVTFLTPLAKPHISMVVLEDGFISTANPELGDAFAMLETMIVTGAMPRIGFNYTYLRDALKGETGMITMSGNDDTMPVLVVGQVAQRVVMPMRASK